MELVHPDGQDEVDVVARDEQGADTVDLVDFHGNCHLAGGDGRSEVRARDERSGLQEGFVGIDHATLRDRAAGDLADDLGCRGVGVPSEGVALGNLHGLGFDHVPCDLVAEIDVHLGDDDRHLRLRSGCRRGFRRAGAAAAAGDDDDPHHRYNGEEYPE